MFKMTLTRKNVLGAITLALTMTFASMPAHAIPVSFDLFYVRGSGISGNDTSLDVTIFLESDDISGGTVSVGLSSVDVIFRNSSLEVFASFANNRTDTTNLSPNNAFFATYIPFTARFVGNVLTGLNGIQPTPIGGLANLSFATPVPVVGGSQAATLFQGNSGPFPGEGNGTKDRSNLGSVSGPFAVIPEPGTFALLGVGLIGLGLLHRRRRSAV